MRALVSRVLVGLLGLPLLVHAEPELAFKVTSVHFSKDVEAKLGGVVSPREVTEAWQKALSASLKAKVIGFDEQTSAEQFGGAQPAGSRISSTGSPERGAPPLRRHQRRRYRVAVVNTVPKRLTGTFICSTS